MSQRQEERRAIMWEKVHKETHEKSIAELQKIKAQLDSLDQNSEDYKTLKSEYDLKYKTAEDFFMQFYES